MPEKPAKKEMSQKKRITLFVALSFVAMALCMGVVMGVAVSLMTDGVYEWEEAAADCPVAAEGEETVLFMQKAAAEANDNRTVYINSGLSVSVDELRFSGSDSEKKLIEHMKGEVVSNIRAIYGEGYSGKFDDGFTDFPQIDLAAAPYQKAYSQYGKRNEEGELTEDDGTVHSFIEFDGFPESFDTQADRLAAQQVQQKFADVFRITAADVKPLSSGVETDVIYASADTPNAGKIRKLTYKRCYDVSVRLSFTGDLSALGSREMSFLYTVRETYDYTWAGIECETELILAKGEEKQLGVNATLNDYSEYTTSFSSSNEAVVSVDELGYIKALENCEEPVQITVTLNYLGREYTAVCDVYVRVPVKKIKISEKELTLQKGESAVLSAALSPDNATDRGIKWISDDETVATVLDGTVTAVGTGECAIRAVADDGDFQAICTVTVA